MTVVSVKKSGSHIVKVTLNGHTDYGEEGEDIVCAGISTLAQTAVLGLMQVVGVNLKFERGDEAYLSFELPELDEKMRHDADVLLDTMMLGIYDLHEGYSRYIKLEVK